MLYSKQIIALLHENHTFMGYYFITNTFTMKLLGDSKGI